MGKLNNYRLFLKKRIRLLDEYTYRIKSIQSINIKYNRYLERDREKIEEGKLEEKLEISRNLLDVLDDKSNNVEIINISLLFLMFRMNKSDKIKKTSKNIEKNIYIWKNIWYY